MVEFAPSILSADFSNLKEEVARVKEANYLHLDVMDGMFVPNITIGPGIIKSIRKHTDLKFDTHLMIEEPERYIKDFAEAGSDIITVHCEATKHLHRLIYQIKDQGCLAGVALNPATSLTRIEHVLKDLDLVLIMSVNPGFGGQKLIPETLNKIKTIKQKIRELNLSIKVEIDGGINNSNVKDVSRTGVDIIVAGSAIFGQPDPGKALSELKERVISS
ncbi:ribulose-phosphate 3-epimerase [Halothermothrix orenii]|uniref:Ribulose-phosphate 3-epimerase n=1 Tax=Halothermothrix orenii (strain H 168 / OCM 544 / DSM 9562) TaxID=373903 RepID=B8CWT5_HALOH|nr:ribulose-phosphate 3-epimerase [Halothermothrix orenii]ACL69754.1 Ribulose-phosphate 3-epimerase [Halothermothrix orenii H 168]